MGSFKISEIPDTYIANYRVFVCTVQRRHPVIPRTAEFNSFPKTPLLDRPKFKEAADDN